MPRPTLLLPCLLATAVAACGGEDAVPPQATGASSDTSSRERADERSGSPDDSTNGDWTGEGVPPARAAAIDRRLDALVAAYAPVSARVNFLVTAETLRRDAVESNAGEELELERTGAVRVELGRQQTLLARARERVADVPVASSVQQRIQRLLLQGIDARRRSLGELELALDGLAREVGDTVVEQRFDTWRASWDQSLRAARAATTAMQDERARAGLAPAPEESFR